MKIHQNEICEGMIQYLERRAGLKRHDVRDRDQGNHMAAAEARVEKTFLLGEQLYAIEHTRIEPFEDFIKLQNTADHLVEPFRAAITKELSSLFDSGVMIEMRLPLDAFIGRDKSKVEAIQVALAALRLVWQTGTTLLSATPASLRT